MLERLRREVVAVDPEVHVGQETSLWGRTAMSLQRHRVMAAALDLTALAGLAMSAIGLYGLVAYHVSRRTREIATRIALGATAGRMVVWALGLGLLPATAGVAAGLLAAWHATRLLNAFLAGVAARDAATFAVAGGVMLAVAGASSALPARRAARLDPATALRHE